MTTPSAITSVPLYAAGGPAVVRRRVLEPSLLPQPGTVPRARPPLACTDHHAAERPDDLERPSYPQSSASEGGEPGDVLPVVQDGSAAGFDQAQ